MAYRLLIQLGDDVRRHGLPEGEHVVGSGQESTIRVPHPTVSRRHARLSVTASGITAEDLGSRNGTRVEGVAIEGRVPLQVPSTLRFGSVHGGLEEAEQSDLDIGIALARRVAEERTPSETRPSTVVPAALETFALRYLPELAEGVARGDPALEVAQAVGSALHRSLPCTSVLVLGETAGGESPLLFEARRAHDEEVVQVTTDAGEGRRLQAGFSHAAFAQSYEPLIQAAAALVRAAAARGGRPRRRGAETLPAIPPTPPPASVVPEMRRIYDEARRVARSRVSVLIRGESGTGKELFARFLHAASERAASPLVALNCAALPHELLEAELFGVERGVATGVDERPGKFEAADRGTLFLDEIADMTLETQARILRALQEGEVYRVGSHTARPVDLRVISATNRDLDALLEDGLFRRDLYHRIADWVVELPPLRERRADIANLAAYFLERAGRERGVRPAGISRAAVDALVAYDWPGNVRQLEKQMERTALFLDDGELLDTALLPPEIASARDSAPSEALQEVRERAEREHIRRILDACEGRIPEAANRLEIGVSTLYAKLKALGIE